VQAAVLGLASGAAGPGGEMACVRSRCRFVFVNRLYLSHMHDGEDLRQSVVGKSEKVG
jgi:hypothetical protein